MKISQEQIAELPVETVPGNIYVVDRRSQVDQAVKRLLKSEVIGFDTETKPSFRRGVVHKVALMQLATEQEAFLFRLNRIGYPAALDHIICNPEISKIGLSLRDDFAAIRKRSDRSPRNFTDLQSFVDRFGIEDNSLQKIYAILFGKKISKNQRLSNWETTSLSPAQKAYAAIDAWACLRIYNHLNNLKNA